MSTPPPDFFAPTPDEPQPERTPALNGDGTAADPDATRDDRTDSGADQEISTPVAEENAPASQPPSPPQWQPAQPSSPPAAPPHSGTLPPAGPAPRPPAVPYGEYPGPRPARPPQHQRAPQMPPRPTGPSAPAPAPGQHYRPQEQGYAPPAGPAPHYSHDQHPPRRGDDSHVTEHTSVISAADIAAARELGDFFNAPPDPNASQYQGPVSPPPFTGAASNATVVPADDRPGHVVTTTRRIEATGWRKAVAVITFGLIKPGPSAKQVAADELHRRIRSSLLDVFVVAFVNSKGGVGKTTMAVAAGNAIARARGDRVIVVDVDTDLGNLSSRFEEDGGPRANIESFAALDDAGRYSTVRLHTVQNSDDLEMLSSQNDPRSSYRLNSSDFEATMDKLRSHYNVVLLDCGTSITSPLFPTIAKQIDCLVVVASQDRAGVNGADSTRAWLTSHGQSHLLARTVVVLNRTGPHKPKIDVDDVTAQFRQFTEEVVLVPFDDHLDEGGAIEFSKMSKRTRKAVTQLAGSIARFYPSRASRGNGGY